MSKTSLKIGKHDDHFHDLLDQIKAFVSQASNTNVLYSVGQEAIRISPHNAELVLSAMATTLRDSDESGRLWEILVAHREDLIEKFLDIAFIPHESDPDLILNLLHRTKIRQNLSVIQKTISYASNIDPTLGEFLTCELFRPALSDVMRKLGAGLFDYLVKQPVVVNGQWDISGMRGENGIGNALLVWAISQLRDQWGPAKGSVRYTLKKLLDAGVDPNVPLKIKLGEGHIKFNSLLEMACWQINNDNERDSNNNANNKRAYLDVIDSLISESGSWNGFDQGDTAAAEHIRQHPLVWAYNRRKDLTQVMADNQTDKKKSPSSRM